VDQSLSAFRNKTAIVGVGRTKSERNAQSNLMGHLGQALKAAVADAGLTPKDIDGLMIQTAPPEGFMDKVAEMLGLPNVRWAFQSWFHGRIQPTCIASAAFAVMSGQANYVACLSTGQALQSHRGRLTSDKAFENFREGGGPHLEAPEYGLFFPNTGAAMGMKKYFLRYGATEEQLGAVAVAQRQWAQLNPDAYFYGRPITIDDYMSSPYVIEPLRVFDHCVPANAGFCIIVTSAERAREAPKAPVYIAGFQGSSSGKERFIFARTGLGVGGQTEGSYTVDDMTVYRMADIKCSDVDIVGTVDAFSPMVPFTLEEFGFCKEGEALEFMQDGRTAPGGELPVNTCGGGLSDVESYGWGHEVDMVRQLRGEAGAAQVPGAKIAQFMSLDRSSVILANA
jgi:acetyl-CoA acetyltransferase